MVNNRDNLYQEQQSSVSKFTFDEQVAEVFADMIARSVPGYQQILELLPSLVEEFTFDKANYYDLGCSLGAGMLAIASSLAKQKTNTTVIGIDNSQAMLDQAEVLIEPYFNEKQINFSLQCSDIRQFKLTQAALVLMNFTLQFIPLLDRDPLLQNIYNNTQKGGALILSEKIKFDDTTTNNRMINIHHNFKARQGYTQLEISQKRDAIENVLIPETLNAHIQRLRSVGFKTITPWVQNLQFISILAIK